MKVEPTLPVNLEQYDGLLEGVLKGMITVLKNNSDNITALVPSVFFLELVTTPLDIDDYVPKNDAVSIAVKLITPIELIGPASDWKPQINSVLEKEAYSGYVLAFVASIDSSEQPKACLSVSIDGFTKSITLDIDLESNKIEFNINELHPSLGSVQH